MSNRIATRFIDALDDPNDEVREKAARALGWWRGGIPRDLRHCPRADVD